MYHPPPNLPLQQLQILEDECMKGQSDDEREKVEKREKRKDKGGEFRNGWR